VPRVEAHRDEPQPLRDGPVLAGQLVKLLQPYGCDRADVGAAGVDEGEHRHPAADEVGEVVRRAGLVKHPAAGGRLDRRQLVGAGLRDGWAEQQPGGESHLPVRQWERRMQPFESPRSAQQFLSTHSAIYNLLNTQRHLISRGSAEGEAGVGAPERCQRTAAGHHLAPPNHRCR
jgi:hypothetical protein